MSYLALARKWRPSTFDQVVGQSHVLTALENALAQNRLHHAYLFSGTRGVGKTSIGRLFAKGLNCETGITSTPCGVCDTCKEIDEGRFVDLLEIDAASRTKVEDTRELLDNVQYKPARGRFKVYLIDEVHMLSRHSFNALLKTLEEPPEYVKFLLATTDPQKLPITILSRCLQFHLKPISVDDIHQQLDTILEKEQVKSEARALGMISHAADGSMRDALSLTDQAIALGNGEILAESVSHMLGTLDTDQAIHLLEAISHKQAQAIMSTVENLAQNGVEWDGLLQELATQLHRIAMYQALPSTLDKSQPDAEKIEVLSQALTPQDVQLYYQIATKGREDIPFSPSARIGIEMLLLRMLAFKPVATQSAQAISTQSNTAPQPNVAPQASTSAITSTCEPVQQAVNPVSAPNVQQQTTPVRTAPQIAPMTPNIAPVNSAGNEMPYGAPEAPPMSSYDEYASMGDYGAPASEPTRPASAQPRAQQRQPEQQQSQEPSPEKPSSPVGGLRHQLRSQRKGLSASRSQGTSSKKASAASDKPLSVLERVASHGGRAQVSQNAQGINQAPQEPAKDEPYQWKASQPEVKEEKKELTPTQIKKALEHVKTPEMAQQLFEESVAQDEWAALVSRLNTAKLVEQLALNSRYKKTGSVVELELRSSQAHLNTDKAQSELLRALNETLGEECQLTVTIGEEGQTPLELREALYQGKLQNAFTSLATDPNIKFIEQRFLAELDKDSVRPI
ncbi:DNA polymerase III subunit gamma/tau [Vibrio maerlii]|uniref:DNA polymerase III subunit gamma/tau n=1 Tax=Vibrio maerlii TaxID=2231648 RepID=UPI000E3B6546|nr:DNA polymerase III subunit gamma/tau [Vibrio maerlii]